MRKSQPRSRELPASCRSQQSSPMPSESAGAGKENCFRDMCMKGKEQEEKLCSLERREGSSVSHLTGGQYGQLRLNQTIFAISALKDSPVTVVSYSGHANPTLPSHKILRSQEEQLGQKLSKTEHSSAVSVPSAVEINLPSPLPTSCCPFNVSEKSSLPFQETSYASITRCAKQTGRGNEETHN